MADNVQTTPDATSNPQTAAPTPQPAPASILDEAAGGEAGASSDASAAPQPTPAETPKDGEGPASLLDEANSEDGKTPEPADGPADDKKDATPETYEAFTLPEGMALDDATLAQATPIFKDLGLDQAKAQKLVSLYADISKQTIEGLVAQQIADRDTLLAEWTTATKAHPEFGGDKLKVASGNVLKAIQTLSDTPQAAQDLVSMLKESGLGNNPLLFSVLSRAGAKLSEDTFITADAAHPQTPKRPEEIMWPGMFQTKE